VDVPSGVSRIFQVQHLHAKRTLLQHCKLCLSYKLCSPHWGHYNMPCKCLNSHPEGLVTLTVDVTAHVRDKCHRSYSIHIPSLKFIGLPLPTISLIFGHGANRPGDFDLLTSKWGHGLPMSWSSFLLIFRLLCLSILDSTADTGQSERQQPSMHYASASLRL